MVNNKVKKIFILIFASLQFFTFAKDVPKLQSRVNDYANIIKASDKNTIEEMLYSLENATGIQIAVLTIDSLDGEDLEGYSIKVADEWKIGQSKEDNGVILLVALAERKIRIETGYGLEGILTDTKCGIIIRNIIIPEFRNSNYSKGILDGVSNIISVLNNDNAALEDHLSKAESKTDYKGIIFGLSFMFGWFILFSCLASGPKNHWLPWVIFTSEFRRQQNRKQNFTSSNFHHNSFGGSGFGGGFSGGGGGFGGGGASGSW